MKRTYTLRRYGDVVTFKCGCYVESWDVSVMGYVDTWEAIKWAAITCGVRLSDGTLQTLFEEARGLRA